MGQNENRQDAHRDHDGVRPFGKKLLRYGATLGFALVAAAACAQRPEPGMVRDPQTGDLRPGTQQMQPPHKVLPWKFNQNEAWQDLLKQVDFGPRVPGTDAHKKCRDWILAELKKSCDEAHLQELTHHWSVNDQDVHMWNVIATQNWENAKQRVVLAAHWDSRPFATEEKDPVLARQPIPGANDGASGVAVLLELARVMKDRHPGIGVMYLMTDGEDLGPDINEMFLGAIYFSKHLPEKKPNYGILLDMIGDKDLQIPMERNSFFKAEKLERTFYRNANDIGLGSTFPVALGQFEIEDDHLSLNDAGIPTIDLIDFTYAPWHTLQDTPAHCSPQSLGKVGYALESWLLRNPPYLQS